jgi:hypothetical protein
LTAAQSYLLAGATNALLFVMFALPGVHEPFLRLGWMLGPWPNFPLPYDFDYSAAGSFDYSSPGSLPESILLAVAVAVTGVLGLTLAVAAVHSIVFSIVALLHAWLGWPRYWHEMRSAISLQRGWAESARRSWWVWPTAQLVWLLWDELAWGFRYACYPIINNSSWFLAANLAAIVMGYAYISAKILRRQIVRIIRPDEVRCIACGYLLKGIESQRCPECGREIGPNVRPVFCFKWQRFGRWKRASMLAKLVLLLLLLTAPLAVPVVLVNLPRNWLRFAPAAIVPQRQVLYPDAHAFPIRLDAVCLIRHEAELAVVRFSQELPRRGRYEVGFWSDANAFGREPPVSIHTGEVTNGGGPDLPLGPWTFRYGMASENMIWLTRPDGTYHVQAFRIECLSGDLSWLESRAEDMP